MNSDKTISIASKEQLLAVLNGQQNVIDWLADIVQKEHKGDRGLIEALIASGFSVGQKQRGKLVHITVTGNAQTGKSHSQSTTAKIFPQVDFVNNLSDKVLLYRKYKDKSILFIDDESLSYVAMDVMKAFTSPDNSVPVVERVMDLAPYRREFPEIVAMWRNAVNLPTDEQVISRFLVFRTQPSEQIGEWAMLDEHIPIDELTLAREVVSFILSDTATVQVKHLPIITGHATPRQRRFIMNLLCAIAYANRYTNPTFNPETKVVEPSAIDYKALIGLVENARLLAAPFMDTLDERLYEFVQTHGSSERPCTVREVSSHVGETEQVCRRRLERMSDFVSYNRGMHGVHQYYVSKPLPDAGYVQLPREVAEA